MIQNSGIYQIRNLINGNLYIGQAKNLKLRKQKHFSELRRNAHKNKHLQNAYLKYGESNFVFEIILICDEEFLTYNEQLLVDKFNPEYNIRRECVDSNIGLKHSEESKKKIKENHTDISGELNPMYGKKQSEESNKKNRESQLGDKGHNYGKILPEETLIKMSNARKGEKCYMFGKKHSEETKRKMSESHKNRLKKP